MLIFVGLGCFAALAVILYFAGVASLKQLRARSSDMEALASATGLRLLDPFPEDATVWKQKRPPHGVDIKAEYPGLPFPTYRTYHMLEGEQNGRKVRLFELSYVVSSGKHTHTVFYGIASVGVGKSVPLVDVRYEGLWQKVKEFFGKADLQLDNPEFDKKYLIATADEHFARSMLDYRVQEEMLREPYDGHLLTAQSAVVYSHGICPTEKLQMMLERATRLAERADMARS